MAKRISVSIVTPERPAWEGEVDSLVVPAFDGALGVWPGHAPLLAQLVPGPLVMRQGDNSWVVAVSGGFVEVLGGKVSVFAETAEMAEDIDAERAHQAAQRARSQLRHSSEEKMDIESLTALERALARLRAVESAARRSLPQKNPKTPIGS